MARRNPIANFPNCPRCGAAPRFSNARFCGHCGAGLADAGSQLPSWQRPAAARYSRITIPRMALSCPECGYGMRFGFRHVCRQCGARLVMVRASCIPITTGCLSADRRRRSTSWPAILFWFAVVLGMLALIGGAR